ncbi:MAG: aminotransferase class IV [Ferrimicrobium sp.]
MTSFNRSLHHPYEQLTTDKLYEDPIHNRFASGCAWIEGEFVPISEARIPIIDMGFTRSDLTYDVVAVWDGSFFRLEDHLERLQRGCEHLRLISPVSMDEIRQILIDTVALSGLRDAYVEAIVTRGIPEKGGRDPRRISARFYAYAIPYVWIANQKDQEKGVALAIAQDTDRISVRSVDPTVKNFHWGDLTRALFEAYDNGASLPILTDGQGKITEGAGYNVFALLDGRLYTPATGVLEGITRKTVTELAVLHGIDMIVGDVSVEMFRAADEIFLTSTAGGVMPVSTLDGKTIGSGGPGPVTTLLRDHYWELHSDERYILPVDYEHPTITT